MSGPPFYPPGGGGAGGASLKGSVSRTELVADANSFCLSDLSSEDWTRINAASAFRVITAVGASGSFIDAYGLNPTSDAPANARRDWYQLAPAGSTSMTLTLSQAKQYSGASTVVIAIYAADGTTLLASTACALTTTPTDYTVTYATTAGTAYVFSVIVNNVGAGTTAQARAICSGVTLTAAGATGIFASGFVRYHCTIDAFVENGIRGDASKMGWRTSPMSRIPIDTNATSLVFEGASDNQAAYPNISGIGVRVNGREQQTIAYTANATLEHHAFTIPSNGVQAVDLYTGFNLQSGGANQGLGQLCSTIRAIYAPASNIVTSRSSAAPNRKLGIYGDSIISGALATNNARMMPARLRHIYGGQVQIEGYGGRALKFDCSTAALRKSFAQRLATLELSELWIEMGVNDWSGPQWTAASYGTAYADLLDQLHAFAPWMQLYCQHPMFKNSEWVANANSEILSDFRDQITTACATRAPWAVVVYDAGGATHADIFNGGGFGGDDTHDGDDGQQRRAIWIASRTGAIGQIVSPQQCPSVVGWFRSDLGMGRPPATWKDLSGNAYNATAVGGNTTLTLGEFPKLTAASGNQILSAAMSGVTWSTTNLQVWAVASMASAGYLWDFGQAPGNRCACLFKDATHIQLYNGAFGPNVAVPAAPALFCAHATFTGSANDTLSVNGTSATANSGSTFPSGSGTAQFSMMNAFPAGANTWIGSAYEFLVANNPTAAEVACINNYFANRYTLTVT